MKKIKQILRKIHIADLSLLCAGLLLLAGCEDTAVEGPNDSSDDLTKPPAAIEQATSASESIISDLGANVAKKATLLSDNEAVKRESGATTYIHFGDEAACTWNPNICSNTFVTWPGYIQNTGYNEWGYAWMSNGPGTGFISYGTGSHYHIMGFLMPDLEPNPKHTAMFGTDWFAFYMQRSGTGRINFDLTQIKVNGTVPITLWFKAANGSWWYWPSLGPGRWNLPGAANIQEFHIRAASGSSTAKYSIDDIQVRGL